MDISKDISVSVDVTWMKLIRYCNLLQTFFEGPHISSPSSVAVLPFSDNLPKVIYCARIKIAPFPSNYINDTLVSRPYESGHNTSSLSPAEYYSMIVDP